MAKRPHPSFPILRRLWRSPWFVAVVGLLAIGFLFMEARKAAMSDFRSRFEASSTARANRVIHEMNEAIGVMQALSYFVQTAQGLDNTTFIATATPFLLARTDLKAVGWVPAADESGLKSAEATRIARPDRYIISFAEPRNIGCRIKGLDLGRAPAIRSALEEARDSGAAAARAWTQDRTKDSRPEFLVLYPVYRKGQVPATPWERRKAIRGYVLALVHLDRVLSDVFAIVRPEGVTVEFLDLSAGPQGQPLFTQSAPPRARKNAWIYSLLPAQSPYLLKATVANREWGIRVTPEPAYVRKHCGLSHWLILPTGLALTFLLVLYRKSVVSQWTIMEHTIAERTAELRAHERRLEELVEERTESLTWKTAFLEAIMDTSWDGILVTDSRGKKILENRRAARLWKRPDSTDSGEDDVWTGFAAGMVKNLGAFEQKVLPLHSLPYESFRDEVELLDGTVLEMYTSAILGKNEAQYGRIWTFHDVTQRKRVEEALRESENLFRDLAEKSILGISLIQDGLFRYVNAQFAAIHGRTVEEMMDRPATLESILPEDVPMVSEAMGRNRSAGHRPIEFRIVRRDGEVRTVFAYATAITHRGRPAVIATLLDLTERRRAEEAVREDEVLLSHATNLAKIVYWELDEVRGEFTFNDAFYALYGTTAALEGGYKMDKEEYMRRFVLPEDRDEMKRRVVENKISQDVPADVEHRAVRRDGAIMRVVTRVKFFRDDENRIVRIVGANQDITERKGVEETLTWKTAFLEAQVNSSPDGILVIDRQGKTILRNQRMMDIWKLPPQAAEGWDDRAQLEHATSLTVCPEAFREKVIFLLRHPNETSRDEVRLQDGTVIDIYSCPVISKDGNYYGRIWTFRDVTELRRYWDMLENLSTTDGLTELPNRRRFNEFLNREWRRSMRDQTHLSLILMDIDFFKEFNDHYGHLAGDDCLRQVASVLSEIVRRPGDLAARFGGEEFACILPDTDLNGATNIAGSVRNKIAEANIPHFFSSVADHVTLSFGVATLTPENGQIPSRLIQLADDLLYSAKQNGRDQIRSWQKPMFRKRASVK